MLIIYFTSLTSYKLLYSSFTLQRKARFQAVRKGPGIVSKRSRKRLFIQRKISSSLNLNSLYTILDILFLYEELLFYIGTL